MSVRIGENAWMNEYWLRHEQASMSANKMERKRAWMSTDKWKSMNNWDCNQMIAFRCVKEYKTHEHASREELL